MANTTKWLPNAKDCLEAAEYIREEMIDLGNRIETMNNSKAQPEYPFPIDIFLAEMQSNKRSPDVIFIPKQLADELWTASLPMAVYANIESAFTRAGMVAGGNRAGLKKALMDLRTRVAEKIDDPMEKLVSRGFVTKTNLIFKGGVLRERRTERISLLQRIGKNDAPHGGDLELLLSWLDDDIQEIEELGTGRSPYIQKEIFVAELARSWTQLTGRSPSKGPETCFGRFVVACWESGLIGENLDTNFERVLRKFDTD